MGYTTQNLEKSMLTKLTFLAWPCPGRKAARSMARVSTFEVWLQKKGYLVPLVQIKAQGFIIGQLKCIMVLGIESDLERITQ